VVAVLLLFGSAYDGRTGPAVNRTPGAKVQLPSRVSSRYAGFKGGRKMWGHGVGRKITFTFDDGPHYQTTPRLLDHLDAFGLKATFFINSRRANRFGLGAAKSYAALVETHRRGHLLANHTHAHPNLRTIPAAKQKRQIELTDQLISRITGEPCYLFRPPYGAMSPYAKGLLHKQGSTVVMWNLGSEDDKYFNVSKVLNAVMVKIERNGGGIILMHDTHYWTIEAVPPIIQAVRVESCVNLARGEEPYEMVGLDYFWKKRGGKTLPRSQAHRQRWLANRAALVKLCNSQPRAPLPAFIRGESS
jgi:peptidoglycan/xylan/chitin deacetylase (PgdA/CDA1 family)